MGPPANGWKRRQTGGSRGVGRLFSRRIGETPNKQSGVCAVSTREAVRWL